jgi:hypothetical protein
MPRRALSPLPVFLGVIALTTALSLLPLRLTRWVGDVAAIVRLPTIPLADLATRFRTLAVGESAREAPDPEDAEFLRAELERYRSLAEQWRQAAEEHSRMVAQLQNTQQFGLSVPYTPVIANIVGRDSQGDGDVFILNVGSHRYGIVPNSIAVYE